MKRAPMVLAGTAIGLVGLVSYHTTATGSVGLAGGLTGPPASGSAGSTASGTTQSASAKTASSSSTSPSTTPSGASMTKSSPGPAVGPVLTRSAVGHDVHYGYGDLSVKVTMTGSKITGISMAAANVLDQQSASIDQYVFPILKREVLNAQSARIQGISGASYTSQAYDQSLQSAIDKLTTAHA